MFSTKSYTFFQGRVNSLLFAVSLFWITALSFQNQIHAQATCTPSTLVSWDMNACASSYSSYTEFTATYPTSSCSGVSASNVYRSNPSTYKHACVLGQGNTGAAMSVSGATNSTYPSSSATKVKFEATITTSTPRQITALKFYAKSPTVSTTLAGSSTNNNYLQKYGIRIYKGSSLVYEASNLSLSTSWQLKTIDLSGDSDFQFSSTKTFKFELVAYKPVNNGCTINVWDLDNITIEGCCSTPVNCNDITGGSIGPNQTICSGGDPAIINNTSSATTSFSGGVKYLWFKYVGSSAPSSMSSATLISGATSASYDPPAGSVTAKTWYRRCAAPNSASCTTYNGETSWVYVNVTTPPTLVCEAKVNGTWSTLNNCAVTVCTGNSLWLSVNPNISTVVWTGPNGYNATGNDASISSSVTTSHAGTYTAVLTDNGCSSTATITVTVNNCTPPVNCNDVTGGYITPNQTICSGGDPAPITNSTSASTSYSGGVKYQWYKYVGSTAPSSLSSATLIPGATSSSYDPPAGSVTSKTWFVRAAAPNSESCTTYSGLSNWKYVSVTTPPTLTCKAKVNGTWNVLSNCAVTVCVGNSLYLGVLSDGSSFSWTGPNGFSSTNQYPLISNNVTAAHAGSYTIVVTKNGCTTSATIVVTVSTCGTPPNCGDITGGSIGNDQTICGGGDPSNIYSITDATTSYSGGVKYLWLLYVGATPPSSMSSATIIPGATSASYDPPAGSITSKTWFRRCAAPNSDECTTYNGETAWVYVDVAPNPDTPTPTTNSASNVCPATSVNLISLQPAAPSTPGGVFEWHTGNDASSPLVDNPTSVGNGTYYLFEKSTANCYSNGAMVTITITTCETVCDNYYNGGSVGYYQSQCGPYTPNEIIELEAPEGGSGASEYIWQSSADNWLWVTIVGATGASYQPDAISSSIYIRRGVRRVNCTSWRYSNAVLKEVTGPCGGTNVCDNFTSGGNIGYDESGTSPFDPSTIVETTAPNGGSGAIEYQWKYNTDGTWIVITGANGSTYDPGAITETTIYRRGVRRANCIEWLYSNEVTKTVSNPTPPNCNDITGGTIGYSQTICTSGDPMAFVSVTPATTSFAGGVKYVWLRYEGANPPADMSLATVIAGANSDTYDAPAGSVTTKTWFRRCAAPNSSTCTVYYGETPWIFVETTTCGGTCDNVTYGGEIGYYESKCAPYDPEMIIETTPPSGGNGTLEYVWLYSTDNWTWITIAGANGPSYDPPVITETTFFSRGVRRAGCTDYIYSNSVLKRNSCSGKTGEGELEQAISGLTILPVPASTGLTVRFVSADQQVCDVQIFDIAGRQVDQQQIEASAGINEVNFDVSRWNAGYYFVSLSNGKQHERAKFTVIR